MKSKIMITLIIVVAAYLAMVLFFYFIQEKLLFHPVKTKLDFQYQFDHDFQEKVFETPDKGNIHALHFFAKNSKGLILYFHGNAGNLYWKKQSKIIQQNKLYCMGDL